MLDKKYYRPKEAAEYLTIGLSTLWLYVKQGKLHSKKITKGKTVFTKEDLDNIFNTYTDK